MNEKKTKSGKNSAGEEADLDEMASMDAIYLKELFTNEKMGKYE